MNCLDFRRAVLADPRRLDADAARHAAECLSCYVCTFPFGDGSAYHVIARTAFGKATLMLLPGRPPAARATATARGLTAVVAPATGGSVTVIGRSSEAVERIVGALRL
jgi:hypothetical protein